MTECPSCGLEKIGNRCLTRWCDDRHESVDQLEDRLDDDQDSLTDGGRSIDDTEQATLEVGETRPPTVIENVRTVSMGSIVSMVMCAHRYRPEDLRGWHTHKPEAVIRGWVQENAEATVSRLLGDRAQNHSRCGPPPLPLEERQERAIEASRPGTQQASLPVARADGGRTQDTDTDHSRGSK